jgi:hypothetical protein
VQGPPVIISDCGGEIPNVTPPEREKNPPANHPKYDPAIMGGTSVPSSMGDRFE